MPPLTTPILVIDHVFILLNFSFGMPGDMLRWRKLLWSDGLLRREGGVLS